MSTLVIWGVVLIILSAIAYLLLLYAIQRQDDEVYWVGIVTSIIVFIIGFVLLIIGHDNEISSSDTSESNIPEI